MLHFNRSAVLVSLSLSFTAALSGCSKSVGYSHDPAPDLAITEPSLPPGTIPVGECDAEPSLSDHGDVSVFARGHLAWKKVSAEGRVFARMESAIKKSQIGTALPTDSTRTDLGVASRLNIIFTELLHGRGIATRSLHSARNTTPFGLKLGVIDDLDLGAIESETFDTRDFLFALQPMGTSKLDCPEDEDSEEGCELNLSGPHPRTNVIDVRPQDLERARKIRLRIPASSTAVIRVKGRTGRMLWMANQEIDLGGTSPEQIVWGLKGIRRLTVIGQNLPGTWVAPNTVFRSRNAEFEGSLYVSCLYAWRTNLKLNSFSGCLPKRP